MPKYKYSNVFIKSIKNLPAQPPSTKFHLTTTNISPSMTQIYLHVYLQLDFCTFDSCSIVSKKSHDCEINIIWISTDNSFEGHDMVKSYFWGILLNLSSSNVDCSSGILFQLSNWVLVNGTDKRLLVRFLDVYRYNTLSRASRRMILFPLTTCWLKRKKKKGEEWYQVMVCYSYFTAYQ